MIVPRLRSEARGGSSSGSSTRYSSGGVYGGKIHHGNNSQHTNDPDLKRALQYSYTSQAVRRWEKRWIVIHETSMRVHKWMPAPAIAPTLASQIVADKTAALANNNDIDQEQQQQQEQESEIQQEQQQQESIPLSTQDTQMLIDEESTSQSSQA
jgi:hypothetical protein